MASKAHQDQWGRGGVTVSAIRWRDEVDPLTLECDELLSLWFAAWVTHDDELAVYCLRLLNMRAPWQDSAELVAVPVVTGSDRMRSIMLEYDMHLKQRRVK